MRTMPRMLRTRLLVIQLAAFTVIWGLLVAYTLFQTYRHGQGAIDNDLRLIAQAIARFTPPDATEQQAMRTAAVVRDMNREASDPPITDQEFAFQIWKADGSLLARSMDSPALPVLRPGSLPDAGSATRSGWMVLGQWNRDHSIYAVVGMGQPFYARVQRRLLSDLMLPYLGMVTAMGIFLWFTLRIGLRPLSRLAASIAARHPGDLTQIRHRTGFLELQPIVDALNDKLGRIRQFMETERQFFDDAAHELRTPLSAISAQAHVLANEQNDEQRKVALGHLEACIDRAARALSKLLLLGRLDAAQPLNGGAPCDLVLVASGVVGAQRPRARLRGQSLLMSGDACVELVGDVEALTIAIENLVDNALRYSREGATIVVDVRASGATASISVTDDGPGIAPADRELVFTRFHRLESASDTTGSGLGLAVVRRIAILHGGTARAIDPPGGGGGGVTILIEMPLHSPHKSTARA